MSVPVAEPTLPARWVAVSFTASDPELSAGTVNEPVPWGTSSVSCTPSVCRG